jgi:hypothetical protein
MESTRRDIAFLSLALARFVCKWLVAGSLIAKDLVSEEYDNIDEQ